MPADDLQRVFLLAGQAACLFKERAKRSRKFGEIALDAEGSSIRDEVDTARS